MTALVFNTVCLISSERQDLYLKTLLMKASISLWQAATPPSCKFPRRRHTTAALTAARNIA
jgi:hypothetical protein